MKLELHHAAEAFENALEGVRNGELSGLSILGMMRRMAKDLADKMALVEEYAMLEAEKYPGKSFQHTDGQVWTKREGARRYEYTGNEVIEALLDRRRPIDDEIELEQKRAQKARERMDLMQAEVVDGKVVMDGGVLVTPAVLKPSKASLTMGKG